MNLFLKIKKIISFCIKNKSLITFSAPKMNDFLLIDNINIDTLKPMLLSDFVFSSISTRVNDSNQFLKPSNVEHYKYYINIRMVFFFLLGLFKNLNFKNSYVYACINCIKPKLILHNTHDFNMIYLAKLLPNINFLILCHGHWYDINEQGKIFESTTMIDDLSKTNVKGLKNFYVLVNGKKDVDLFNEIGVNRHNKEVKLIASGPYEASYHESLNYSKKIKRDIIFISQIQNRYFNESNDLYKQLLIDTKKCVMMLSKYSLEKKLSFSILCRGQDSKLNNESKFFRQMDVNNNIDIIYNKNKPLWKELYSSNILATIDSTVGFDSIAVKKKTLLMNMTFASSRKYEANSFYGDITKIWKWTIINDNYENFKTIINNLEIINQQKYEKEIYNMRKYWFNCNSKIPAYKNIQEIIKEKLM